MVPSPLHDVSRQGVVTPSLIEQMNNQQETLNQKKNRQSKLLLLFWLRQRLRKKAPNKNVCSKKHPNTLAFDGISPNYSYKNKNVTHAIIQVVQIFSQYYRWCYLDVRHFSSKRKNKKNTDQMIFTFQLSFCQPFLCLAIKVFSKCTIENIILFKIETAIKTIFNLKRWFSKKNRKFHIVCTEWNSL